MYVPLWRYSDSRLRSTNLPKHKQSKVLLKQLWQGQKLGRYEVVFWVADMIMLMISVHEELTMTVKKLQRVL